MVNMYVSVVVWDMHVASFPGPRLFRPHEEPGDEANIMHEQYACAVMIEWC